MDASNDTRCAVVLLARARARPRHAWHTRFISKLVTRDLKIRLVTRFVRGVVRDS